MRLKLLLAVLASLMCLPACANIVIIHAFSFDFGANPPNHSDPFIEVGDTVRWIDDGGIHTSTSAAGQAESWDSPFLSLGDTFDHTFTQVGSFNYYCAIHGIDLGGGNVAGMSGKVVVANTVFPTSFNILRGILISGGLPDTQTSNDQYMVIQKGLVLNLLEAAIQVTFTGTSPTATPLNLAVSLEDGSNASGLTRRVEMMNFQTNQFEQIDQNSVLLTDKLNVFMMGGDLSRFVNPQTMQMTVKLSYPVTGPISTLAYRARFDRIAFMVH